MSDSLAPELAMIKVRVVRGIQTGLPLASSLLALSGVVTACAADAEPDDFEADESALTVTNPGTGVFELGWAYGTPTGYSFTAKNSTDEYVRALEKMTFTIPAHFLWSQLYPTEALPTDLQRLTKLSAKVTVTYDKQGASFAQASVKTLSWQGDQPYSLTSGTGSFTVNRRAESMRFAIEITDKGVSPQAKKTLDESSFFAVPVIGGTLPQKTVLFDSQGPTLRTRILEGGDPVRGADLAIGYTDWRAATLVDVSSIDRQIGTATSFSRFGAIEIPIYGELEYEIAYGAAIDGTWQEEQALTANGASRLMPPVGRTAYEGNVSIPKKGQSLAMYFHVKAFLKVDYSRYPNVLSRRYEDGARFLVRERWDNENGATNDNYDFTLESR
jgi:hypothetical protein